VTTQLKIEADDLAPGALRYDYERQCWVRWTGTRLDGAAFWTVEKCGHYRTNPHCFACLNHGKDLVYEGGKP
jgi:hypothetical protein